MWFNCVLMLDCFIVTDDGDVLWLWRCLLSGCIFTYVLTEMRRKWVSRSLMYYFATDLMHLHSKRTSPPFGCSHLYFFNWHRQVSAALKLCSRLASRWNSWMMIMWVSSIAVQLMPYVVCHIFMHLLHSKFTVVGGNYSDWLPRRTLCLGFCTAVFELYYCVWNCGQNPWWLSVECRYSDGKLQWLCTLHSALPWLNSSVLIFNSSVLWTLYIHYQCTVNPVYPTSAVHVGAEEGAFYRVTKILGNFSYVIWDYHQKLCYFQCSLQKPHVLIRPSCLGNVILADFNDVWRCFLCCCLCCAGRVTLSYLSVCNVKFPFDDLTSCHPFSWLTLACLRWTVVVVKNY